MKRQIKIVKEESNHLRRRKNCTSKSRNT
jgi:hypothetical protein